MQQFDLLCNFVMAMMATDKQKRPLAALPIKHLLSLSTELKLDLIAEKSIYLQRYSAIRWVI